MGEDLHRRTRRHRHIPPGITSGWLLESGQGGRVVKVVEVSVMAVVGE